MCGLSVFVGYLNSLAPLHAAAATPGTVRLTTAFCWQHRPKGSRGPIEDAMHHSLPVIAIDEQVIQVNRRGCHGQVGLGRSSVGKCGLLHNAGGAAWAPAGHRWSNSP